MTYEEHYEHLKYHLEQLANMNIFFPHSLVHSISLSVVGRHMLEELEQMKGDSMGKLDLDKIYRDSIACDYDDEEVSCPSHYAGDGIDCKEALQALLGIEGMAAYWRGCAFKYLWRYDRKGGIKDLHKAIQCIEYLIEVEEGTSE